MIDAAIVRLLLEASLRVLIVAAAVGGVLALARVRKGSVRHSAWTAVVITMLLMPALVFVVPQFEVPRAPQAITFLPVPSDLPYIGEVDFDQRVGAPQPTAGEATVSLPSVAVPNATEPTTARVASKPPAVDGGFPLWLVAVAAIYTAGLFMLLVRWIRASRFLARLRRSSCRIESPEAALAGVYESSMAATPITVGGMRPWIVLPMEWRSWPREKLAAVLAHERSHVRRKDPLIGLVAYLNRCIYWFNPLAWWLERQVAAAAEHAADEDGVKAIGKGKAYAEVLLDMTETVRQHGGRVAWQGVGVDGNGLLGKRIDRVLSGSFLEEVSQMKRRIVLAVVVVAIGVAVACKRQPDVPELLPNPEIVAQKATQEAQSKKNLAARNMTPAELAEVKARLAANRDDFDALEKLLTYYNVVYSRPMPPDDPARVAARRPYILDLIARHPAHELAGSWVIRMFPAPTDPLNDPEGYAKAKALWLAHAEKPDVPPAVLKHAATFLEAYDPALSEAMLLKARVKEPRAYSAQLGRLYGIIVSGTYAATPLNVPRFADSAHALSPLAMSVRAKLDKSDDAIVLAGACGWLFRNSLAKVDFDAKKLGRTYCERAVSLGWKGTGAEELLAREDDLEQHKYIDDKLRQVPLEQKFTAVYEFAEAERLQPLLEMAERAYEISRDGRDWSAQSIRMANDALALAEKPENKKMRASAIYRANLVLGANVLRKGDRKAAVKFLLTAADAPPARRGAFEGFATENDLVNYLLKYGERESIIEFYEKAAKRGTRDTQLYLDSAKDVRAGQMPMRYQYFWVQQTAAAARK